MKTIRYLLHHYLSDAVAAHASRIAVRSGEKSITYEELDRKSNKLARILRAAGFRERETAGVLLGKSIEAIIGFFAILKSGGAYIPLDVHYSPPARLKGIMSLSRVKYIVTDAARWGELSSTFDEKEKGEFEGIRIVTVDGMIGDPVPECAPAGVIAFDDSVPGEIPGGAGITEADLAYILYTSGSTGVPKGVMISHRNAMTFIDWGLSYFDPPDGSNFANHAPLHFDLSVFDIYVALASGGTVNLVPFSIAGNPRALVRWIGEEGINFWYSVPSVWVTILNFAKIEAETLGHLTHIIFAGEVFPPKYLRALMEALPEARYFNLYGPTETNVCTYYEVKDPGQVNERAAPIGKACENTEVVVLNERNNRAEIGEEGELFVRGPCVTKGYYGNPSRTARAFVGSPLDCHNGELLYRTGDVVRRVDEENYEYVGRVDLMVKCSGFRIELQEIENALLRNPLVKEAVVVPRRNDDYENTTLCAYICVDGNGCDTLAMKEYCRGELPYYMIPETIAIVDAIPRNANGKIDRQEVASWAANRERATECARMN